MQKKKKNSGNAKIPVFEKPEPLSIPDRYLCCAFVYMWGLRLRFRAFPFQLLLLLLPFRFALFRLFLSLVSYRTQHNTPQPCQEKFTEVKVNPAQRMAT